MTIFQKSVLPWVLLIVLVLVVLGGIYYESTLTETSRIKSAINDYMRSNMNDYNSYEPLEYDATYMKNPDGSKYGIRVFHSFRGKNGFGATIVNVREFELIFKSDSTLTVINCK